MLNFVSFLLINFLSQLWNVKGTNNDCLNFKISVILKKALYGLLTHHLHCHSCHTHDSDCFIIHLTHCPGLLIWQKTEWERELYLLESLYLLIYSRTWRSKKDAKLLSKHPDSFRRVCVCVCVRVLTKGVPWFNFLSQQNVCI